MDRQLSERGVVVVIYIRPAGAIDAAVGEEEVVDVARLGTYG